MNKNLIRRKWGVKVETGEGSGGGGRGSAVLPVG